VKTQNVIFYSPFAIWPYHFETELDLIEQHLQENCTVTLLSCSGKLPTCEPNPKHERWTCRMCKSRLNAGIKWVGSHRIVVEDFYWISETQQFEIERLNSINISSVEDLKNISLEGSDIGLAALSSTVSYLREPNPDVHKNIDIIRNNLITSAIIHFSIKNHLISKKPDLFFICNGRFSAFRPALRIAQSLGVKTYVHERAGILEQYYLCKNSYPHDLKLVKQNIESVYQESKLSEAEKKEIAHAWYEERLNNQIQGWFSFTENQKKELLPRKLIELPSSVMKVAIFNSSEDEFVAFDEWKNPFYFDQNDGINQIAEDFENQLSIQFFLRIHPNLSGLNNSQTKRLERLKNKFNNLEVIDADSKVGTYALMKACDLVLTFGSTVGIEALYQGKPSILMSRAFYEDLDGIIKPSSHSELIQILKNYLQLKEFHLAESGKISLIKYGLFQKVFGCNFKYAKPYEISKVSLIRHGKESFLEPSIYAKALNKLRI
jgi:Capsule polysaccharide biosynthesis protein